MLRAMKANFGSRYVKPRRNVLLWFLRLSNVEKVYHYHYRIFIAWVAPVLLFWSVLISPVAAQSRAESPAEASPSVSPYASSTPVSIPKFSDKEIAEVRKQLERIEQEAKATQLMRQPAFLDAIINLFRDPLAWVALSATIIGLIGKVLLDYFQRVTAERRLLDAEKKVFESIPEASELRQRGLIHPEDAAQILADVSSGTYQGSTIEMVSLFNLYNKQIEKYQTQTQSRAGWSFFFAIVAMISGLALVVWGGTHIVLNAGWEHVAAGALISTVGGAVSAFIAKTFLDVHRMSLVQLNNYFSQPVLNSHILTAQRLADLLPTEAAKQKAYESIISKVADLIAPPQVQQPTIPLDSRAGQTRKRKRLVETKKSSV